METNSSRREAVFADSVGFLRLFPGWLFPGRFGGYVFYQYRWSPYAWGIRAHEASVKLNLEGQEKAFGLVVKGIQNGRKNEVKGRVLDLEKQIEEGE